MKEKQDRIFIIDGYGQIYRSYFAFMTNPLKDRSGNNVSAVYGFFNTIMSLVRQYDMKYLVVAMDSKGKTFRHEMYDQYKANREKTPEDLHAQIPVIESFLEAMHIPCFKRQGMEADDIIATIAKKATKDDLEAVMVTGDKDLLQLVREGVFALRPPRKGEKEYRLFDSTAVKEIFGVEPEQIVDYLTILGDSSDNVPGIAGIGEKGAVKLLTEFGSLENAYQNIDKLSKGVATKLEAARDHIELSHDLVLLKDDVFCDAELDFSHFETSSIDWNEGVKLFRQMGSETLAKAAQRLAPQTELVLEAEVEEKEEVVIEVKTIECSEQKLKELFESKENGSSLCIRINDSSFELCFDKGLVYKTNLNDKASMNLIQENLKRYFVIGQDIKSLKKEYVFESYADLNIMAWLLNTELTHFESLDASQGLEKYDQYVALLKDKGLYDIFTTMEMPLLSVLCEMENIGIKLDVSRLNEYGNELDKAIDAIANDVYTLCGKTFNLNSPKQLQEVLFVDRNLPTGKKTKSGFSTDSDVLEYLAQSTEDPVPALLLRYRALSKLSSTYVQALPELVDEDSRIHTTFLQTGTATGRLSSKSPNLQNIPIRTDEGRRIRDAFIPREGCTLMSADYSQIELVVLAHITGDRNLRSAFINGSDVHKETAALIFGIFPEMVTAEQRRVAKTINFGIMYGMSAFRLSGDLGIPRKDAQNFIDTYFEQYHDVRSFVERTKEEAKRDGFVKTLMGHIRYISEIKSSNKTIQAAAERAAVNTIIQGTAAEIVKKAMLALDKEIKSAGLSSRMLLQVHDEVIFEVPHDEVEIMTDLVRRTMESAYSLSVPLRVSIETGSSWGEMH